jgi:uncharacterized protein YbbK (DUF523 family)
VSNTSTPITISNKGESDGLRRILVSGCINGPAIRYNRTNVTVVSPVWDRWVQEDRVVPFCGELAAGFAVPRPPAEIVISDSIGVLNGTGTVAEDIGTDVTAMFVRGAELAVEQAIQSGCVAAVLTDGSPSCGSTYQYDGLFQGGTRAGTGVVAQLLIDHGIRVFPETQLELADQFIRQEAG